MSNSITMVLRNRNLNVNPNFPMGKAASNKEHAPVKRKSSEKSLDKQVGKRRTRSELAREIDDNNENQVDEDIEIDPAPEVDFDKENEHDMTAVAHYAQDIFLYYKHRENLFRVGNYLNTQVHVTQDARAVLVNWMVDMQETFELNHETLYLAVKLIDLYIDKTPNVLVNRLQLIASASVFISSKFDERSPPLIDDFIYVAEDAFDRDSLLSMEREFFRTVGFDIGAPISYRFLRRYARVCKVDMPTLTLARYILETSLMFLSFCRLSESLIAAASFLLALRMKKVGDWTPTLQKYSGYKKEQVEPLVQALNHMIIKRKVQYKSLDTVYKKYSHEIFHEVALIESLPDVFPISKPIMPYGVVA